jgi:hypothetical protein
LISINLSGEILLPCTAFSTAHESATFGYALSPRSKALSRTNAQQISDDRCQQQLAHVYVSLMALPYPTATSPMMKPAASPG